MHAPVHAKKVQRETHQFRPAHPRRVEQPHLEIVLRVQCGQRRIHSRNAVVVEEQAHAHAAARGVGQSAQQQPAGNVVVPDVILNIERTFRLCRQQKPARQRLVPGSEWQNAGLSRMVAN